MSSSIIPERRTSQTSRLETHPGIIKLGGSRVQPSAVLNQAGSASCCLLSCPCDVSDFISVIPAARGPCSAPYGVLSLLLFHVSTWKGRSPNLVEVL